MTTFLRFPKQPIKGGFWTWQCSDSAHLQYQHSFGTKEFMYQVPSRYLNVYSCYRLHGHAELVLSF